MELVKKPVRTYRTISIVEPEEMFEHSIIVPDVKPDVRSILMADAEGFVVNIEKTGRMVEVSGEIQYKILYISDTPEQRIESITARYPWSISLQKPKNDGEIGIFVRSRCQHSDVNIVNGRKIVCRTVTSLVCRFYEIRSDEIGREILGENVFLKTRPVNIVSLKDLCETSVRVNDVLALPPGRPAIKEILFSRINLGRPQVNYREEETQLECKGTLFLLYRSDTMDESIESVILEFPVKVSTGVQAGENAMVFASGVLKDWEIRLKEDDDGLYTRLSVNLEIEVDTQAMVNEEQMVIEDAYSCECRMELGKLPVKVTSDAREFCEEAVISQRISLDSAVDPLDEVLMVCANERNISSLLGESIGVQGTLGLNILFLTRGKEYQGRTIDLPFNHYFQLPEIGDWRIIQTSFNIEDVRFDIAGTDSIDVSIILKIGVRICKVEEIASTDSINMVKEESQKRAPFIIYFTQPNDTLWDVAKHYRIPVSRLCSDNNIESDARLEPGKRLFIMG